MREAGTRGATMAEDQRPCGSKVIATDATVDEMTQDWGQYSYAGTL